MSADNQANLLEMHGLAAHPHPNIHRTTRQNMDRHDNSFTQITRDRAMEHGASRAANLGHFFVESFDGCAMHSRRRERLPRTAPRAPHNNARSSSPERGESTPNFCPITNVLATFPLVGAKDTPSSSRWENIVEYLSNYPKFILSLIFVGLVPVMCNMSTQRCRHADEHISYVSSA